MIHLEPSLVPATLKGGYTGKRFRAVITEAVTVPADAGLWSGGSRDSYGLLRIADGVVLAMPGQGSAPWNPDRKAHEIALKPGFCVVKHSHFCGKDMGLTFYLSPQDAAPMLPAPVELSEHEALVLEYTISRKSSYMGQNRFQMACQDIQRGYRAGTVPTAAQWDEAKASLIAKGFLTRAGAVTPAGRNARK